MLQARGIAKAFGGVPALRGVSFEVARGEVRALLGANGAGKSTLIRIIEGALAPDSGSVELEGRPVVLRSPRDAHALGIHVIHQELALVPELTVAENVFLGREPTRGPFVDRRAMEEGARAVLQGELGLGTDVRAKTGSLGTGERQAVEIARALSANARLIALDEPTTSLSDAETQRLFDAIRRQKAKGCSFIYVSHRLEEIPLICDRVTVLQDGACVLAAARTDSLPRERIIELLAGPTEEKARLESAEPGEVLLEARAIRPRGERHAWSLSLRKGEIVGLSGLVGAGRSTLARALAGAVDLDAGELRLDGAAVTLRSPADALARGVVLLPEDRRRQGIFPALPVRENASVSALRELSFFGLVKRAEERTRTAELARDLRVKAASLEQAIATLSGGNQQKVLLARALLARARVIIADEPTRGIDVGARAEIHDLLRRLASQGLAVLVVSSDDDELLGLCRRILVLSRGAITGELAASEATREKLLALALGDAA